MPEIAVATWLAVWKSLSLVNSLTLVGISDWEALPFKASVITLFCTGLVDVVDKLSSTAIVLPPCISILPLPSNELPLMVLILVPETRVSCFELTSDLVANPSVAKLTSSAVW